MLYYLNSAAGRSGPFTTDELILKKISRDTMVWGEGYTDWMAAGDVPELAEVLRSSAPAHKTFGLDTAVIKEHTGIEKKANFNAFVWTMIFIAVLLLIVYLLRP